MGSQIPGLDALKLAAEGEGFHGTLDFLVRLAWEILRRRWLSKNEWSSVGQHEYPTFCSIPFLNIFTAIAIIAMYFDIFCYGCLQPSME